MEIGYHPAPVIGLLLGEGELRLEGAVDARISAVPDQVGRAAVQQGVEHVVVVRVHLLHHPGDDDTIVVYQIEQGHGNALPGRAGLAHLELIGRVVAEHQALHAPVGDLLGAGEDPLGEQVLEALPPEIQTVPAAHIVHGIGAFIRLIAGEDIQVGTVQADIMLRQLAEIALHIIRGLGGAEVCLMSACPVGVLRNGAVRLEAAEGGVEGLPVEIVVPVLVVDAEEISAVVEGIRQLLHAIPAAGLLTGGQIVGMLVVVSRVSPAVQVQVELLEALGPEGFDLLCPCPEGHHPVVLAGMLRIVHGGFRAYMILDSPMEEEASDQPLHPGGLRRLFLQAAEQALLLHIAAVHFADIVVVTSAQQRVAHDPAVAHLPQAGPPAHPGFRVGPSGGMLRVEGAVPGLLADGDVPFSGLHLAEPGHVTGGGAQGAAEGELPQLRLPGIGNQEPLMVVQQRVPVLPFLPEGHGPGPCDGLDAGTLFPQGDPLEEHVPRGPLDPYIGAKAQAGHGGVPIHGKALIPGEDSLPQACLAHLVGDGSRVQEGNLLLCRIEYGYVVRFPAPIRSVPGHGNMQIGFVKAQFSPRKRDLNHVDLLSVLLDILTSDGICRRVPISLRS